jgi:hypothetical protein
MCYPDGATTSGESQWGVFDAKKGLRVQFVEEPGLFEISLGMENQIFGFTPRLTEDKALQLDIYLVNESPPPDYPNAENAEDIGHTWIMSNMMQIMFVSYGSIDIFSPVYTVTRDGSEVSAQYDPLFNPPYTINETIASLLNNSPPGTTIYFSNGVLNQTCLLDYQSL